MIGGYLTKQGFALPTILITSVIMMMVLVSAVTATSSVRTALDGQYYTQLAREAAESGVARANACLQENGYSTPWSNSSPLRPNTSCSGGAACTSGSNCFVMNRGGVRTTFVVYEPWDYTVSQLVSAEGVVELLRPSNNAVWRNYSYVASARVGVDLSFNTVAFSYAGSNGAHFATIAADGKVRSLGYNGWGQLGNGSYSNSVTPQEFMLSGSDRGISAFTNFMAGGYQTYVLTNAGDIFGAGLNTSGQLGDGTMTSKNVPVRFGLPTTPTRVKGKSVASTGHATFVLGDDNNIYAVGLCDNGLLGYTYTISGCAHQSTPRGVTLPTPSSSNLYPTTNIVTKSGSAFVRLQGGQVYGWGLNSDGQFANATTTSSSTPIQISTYGNSGLPRATQVAFDGVSLYVLDDTGRVRAAGSNGQGGQLAGKGITIQNGQSGRCLDNAGQDGVTVWSYTCNDTVAQNWTFRDDGSIYHPNKDKCLDNRAEDAVTVQLYACNGSVAQRFTLRNDGTIYLINHGRCLSDVNGNGSLLQFAPCNATANQAWSLRDQKTLVDVNLPAAAGRVLKVATDQWFTAFLMENGEVWSAGTNHCGQLGNGATARYQPYPVKFILPAGVTAVDVHVTAYGTISECNYNNTFVIGSDGKVYGAGSNVFGQLGDGTTTNRSTPVAMQVINGTTVRAEEIVSGYGTTVVIATNRKVYTVGNNQFGQLGDGTTTNSSVPKANKYTNVLPVTVF